MLKKQVVDVRNSPAGKEYLIQIYAHSRLVGSINAEFLRAITITCYSDRARCIGDFKLHGGMQYRSNFRRLGKMDTESFTFKDEVVSINAIYDSRVLSPISDPSTVLLHIPASHIKLRLNVPRTYPEEAPHIVGPVSSGEQLKKGQASHFADHVRNSLKQVFRVGEPCFYDLVEEVLATSKKAEESFEEASSYAGKGGDSEKNEHMEIDSSVLEAMTHPAWILSETVNEKKSVFVARTKQVDDASGAKFNVQHLILSDKRVAKATHNITAWRIRNRETGVVYRDCDDDGETAAGGRLLHLLDLMNIWNVVVVVSRWYGGIHLGPDRFRIINSVARDAVIKAGFDKFGTDVVRSRSQH